MSEFTQALSPPVLPDHGDGDGGFNSLHSSITVGLTGRMPLERRQANIAEGEDAGQTPLLSEQAPLLQQTEPATEQMEASSLQLRTAKLTALEVCPATVTFT